MYFFYLNLFYRIDYRCSSSSIALHLRSAGFFEKGLSLDNRNFVPKLNLIKAGKYKTIINYRWNDLFHLKWAEVYQYLLNFKDILNKYSYFWAPWVNFNKVEQSAKSYDSWQKSILHITPPFVILFSNKFCFKRL